MYSSVVCNQSFLIDFFWEILHTHQAEAIELWRESGLVSTSQTFPELYKRRNAASQYCPQAHIQRQTYITSINFSDVPRHYVHRTLSEASIPVKSPLCRATGSPQEL